MAYLEMSYFGTLGFWWAFWDEDSMKLCIGEILWDKVLCNGC